MFNFFKKKNKIQDKYDMNFYMDNDKRAYFTMSSKYEINVLGGITRTLSKQEADEFFKLSIMQYQNDGYKIYSSENNIIRLMCEEDKAVAHIFKKNCSLFEIKLNYKHRDRLVEVHKDLTFAFSQQKQNPYWKF